MRQLVLSLLSMVLIVGNGNAREATVPPGHPPRLWLASSTLEDGKVVIQIARAWPKSSDPKKNPAADGIVWDNLRKVTLGETVQAYGVDGEPLNAETVLKVLAEPKGVAVFVQIYSFDPPKPPPFYLEMLREGTIVFVVKGVDVYDLRP